MNPPESDLQERVCRVQPRGVHVSDARQDALHLVFITEDITKKKEIRTKKKNHLYSEEQNFDVDGLVYLTGSDETE